MRAWERHIKVELGVGTPLNPDTGEGGEIFYSDVLEYYYPGGVRRYMEFEASMSKDPATNSGELRIYNLSDAKLSEWYEAFRKAGMTPETEEEELSDVTVTYVKVYAGYQDNIGLIFRGRIKELPETKFEGADKVTVIRVADDCGGNWGRKRCPGAPDTEFPPGTYMQDIAEKLAALTGIPLGRSVTLGVDYQIKETKSFGANYTIRRALEEVCQDTLSVVYVYLDRLYVVPKFFAIPTGLVLDKTNGLVWSNRGVHRPEYGGKRDIEFACLITPLIFPNCVVTVKDATGSVQVRVEEYKIRINDHDYYLECSGPIYDAEESRRALVGEVEAAGLMEEYQRMMNRAVDMAVELGESLTEVAERVQYIWNELGSFWEPKDLSLAGGE